jgi:hypothetical protein
MMAQRIPFLQRDLEQVDKNSLCRKKIVQTAHTSRSNEWVKFFPSHKHHLHAFANIDGNNILGDFNLGLCNFADLFGDYGNKRSTKLALTAPRIRLLECDCTSPKATNASIESKQMLQ